MKILLAITIMLISQSSLAACKWAWVDHDSKISTPAIQKEICDSSIRIPTVRPPSVRPIQSPSVRPIQIPRVPPVGTTRCRIERVYTNGKWINQQVCR
jgi:hypothetical protein